MRSSDLIAQFISELLEKEGGSCEIQRNELAALFSCVPSQINYVISTRFSPEYGYLIESRRGGGGYIRIVRRKHDTESQIMHIVNSIGDSLDGKTARILIYHLESFELLKATEAKILAAATCDNCFSGLSPSDKDTLRARIFKNILLTLS